jgi:hypothetical protein
LYAVEETPTGYKTLILSEAVPTRPDWCPAEGWATKALPINFLQHSRYVFRLTACATRILSSDGGKKRISLAKRTGPDDEPESRLLDWLERKGDGGGGFRMLRHKTLVLPMEVQAFSTSDKSHRITIQYTL